MREIVILLLSFLSCPVLSQENPEVISGRVLDSKTKLPLSYASIQVAGQDLESMSASNGAFELRLAAPSKGDSLEVSHLGYKTFRKRIRDLKFPLDIYLEEHPVELKTVLVTSGSLDLNTIDKALRIIKDNLYAYETETSNSLYRSFLTSLEAQGQFDLLKQCDFDLSSYDAQTKAFYQTYTAPYRRPLNKTDTTAKNYSDFPVVNISHGAAVMFCQWLTQQYNSRPGKKKFKNVKFRLPTLEEWQIAALGYAEFQSWELDKNTVGVIIPDDTVSNPLKGKRTYIKMNNEILYPWFVTYNYRNKAQNRNNCFLGNFKMPEHYVSCMSPGSFSSGDGWIKMASTACYYPNDMGFYDVVGNVAEMIDEKGKACGGSWNDLPASSTIRSIKNYKRPGDTIGFRVFMEVVTE